MSRPAGSAPTLGAPAGAAGSGTLSRSAGTSASQAVARAVQEDSRSLLTSLTENAQLAPAIKAIYDRGWLDSYEGDLERSVSLREAEIAQTSSDHCDDLLTTVESLLYVRQDLGTLRSKVDTLNSTVQVTGSELVASADDLIETRVVRRNIGLAIHVIRSCTLVFELLAKAVAQIDASKFFSAIKTIRHLETEVLPKYTDFEFHAIVAGRLPRLLALITDVTRADFIAWLGHIKARSRVVGALALARLDAGLRLDAAAARRPRVQQLQQLTGGRVGAVPALAAAAAVVASPGGSGAAMSSTSAASLLPGSPASGLGVAGGASGGKPITAAAAAAAAAPVSDVPGAISAELFALPPPLPDLSALANIIDPASASGAGRGAAGAADAAAGGAATVGTLAAAAAAPTDPEAPVSWLAADGEDLSIFDRADVSFAVMHRSLHTYAALELRQVFSRLYVERRQTHALQLGGFPAHMPITEFKHSYLQHFADVIGFFVVEDAVLVSGAPLFSRTAIESLWDTAVLKLRALLDAVLPQFTAAPDLLAVKHAIAVFARTAEHYGFSAAPLVEVATVHYATFERLLISRFQADARAVFGLDKYEPHTVTSVRDYVTGVLAFGLVADSGHGSISRRAGAAQDAAATVRLPAVMPFSVSVVMFCKLVKSLASGLSDYAARLSPSLEPLVWQAVDTALHFVNAQLADIIDRVKTIHISQVVQFAINTAYLTDACDFFSAYLATVFAPRGEGSVGGAGGAGGQVATYTAPQAPSSPAGSGAFQLPSAEASFGSGAAGAGAGAVGRVFSAQAALAQTRARCESLMFELLDTKIDQFLSLSSSFNWAASAPQTAPSAYITDLVSYLDTTLQGLVFLPASVRETAYYAACRHVSSALLNAVQSVKKFTQIGIYNLGRDVAVLERFALKYPIPSLRETFAELRQFVDLVVAGDLTAYGDEALRMDAYPNLNPAKVAKTLDRYKEIPDAPPGMVLLKKKTVDALLTKLKKTNT